MTPPIFDKFVIALFLEKICKIHRAHFCSNLGKSNNFFKPQIKIYDLKFVNLNIHCSIDIIGLQLIM